MASTNIRSIATGLCERFLPWLLASALLTAAVAWVAFQVQQEGIAPAVILPLLVGAALGMGEVVILRHLDITDLRLAVSAALLWGLLVVVGQDYIGHRHRSRLYDAEMDRQGPLVAVATNERDELRPGFVSYLVGVVGDRPVWWTLDLVLSSGAAVAVTAWGVRKGRIGVH